MLLISLLWSGMNSVIQVMQANLGFAIYMPYVLLCCAFLIAYFFRQGRIAMISVALLASYWLIQHTLSEPADQHLSLIKLSLFALLLPVACWQIYLFKNETIWHPGFLAFLLSLGLIIGWASLLISDFDNVIMTYFIEFLSSTQVTSSPLPIILAAYIAILTLYAGILVYSHNRLSDVVIYSTLLVVGSAFTRFDVPFISSTMFSLIAVLMMIYLISTSYKMAFTDTLTQLPARQALEIDLRQLGKKYTLAMVDIDHFKSFNDTYGHDAGDDVLRLIASRLALIKGNGRVYRYGGEEFLILFKGKETEQCSPLLEQVRNDIAGYPLVLRNYTKRPSDNTQGRQYRHSRYKQDCLSLTVSIGISDSLQGDSVTEILDNADKALYSAKSSGRNCIKRYSPQ
ncbi:GGDEF domain-containing protein [Vibrio tritonius]|uniref:GGDEF domain-containing protein n=1 Tax=Vibrio tritonius TaxID=1435069 RepID=UPI00138F4A1C|nr:diguanylate cyclase [Vibrio tritonius]